MYNTKSCCRCLISAEYFGVCCIWTVQSVKDHFELPTLFQDFDFSCRLITSFPAQGLVLDGKGKGNQL